MDELQEFGRYLAELRVARGFETQRALAAAAGVSPATISRVEGGVQRAEPDTLARLAPVLGEDYESLMRAAGYLPQPGPEAGGPPRQIVLTAESTDEEIREFLRLSDVRLAGNRRLAREDEEELIAFIRLWLKTRRRHK